MSTKNTRNGPNTFESSLGGLTVSGKAHSLSAWFVLVLRLVIGFAFRYSGAQKVLGGFAAGGYLNSVPRPTTTPSRGWSPGWPPRRGSSTS